MIQPARLTEILHTYQIHYPGESALAAELEEALSVADGDPTARSTLPGHFTASALVLSPEGTHTLAIHHALLGIWIQPGGHIDPGEPSLRECARREAVEETGLQDLRPIFPEQGEVPFYIDSHPIPFNERKQEPAHQHYDFRYAFYADPSQPLQAEAGAVIDVAWMAVDDDRLDDSVRRSARKLLQLLAHKPA